MKNEIAVLIAAGKGERMRPLTLKKPKPLVRVYGKPMIETVIDGLIGRGVKDIYVVVGYLGEQFDYLLKKYGCVHIIKNTEYTVKNNISSIHAAREVFKDADCFVCEADLYVSDPGIFKAELKNSCYFGKFVKGYSGDWLFTRQGDRITHIGKGGSDEYNMCGISYFKAADIKIVSDGVEKAYESSGHEQLFWDEIVDAKLQEIYMTVHPVGSGQIVEIDTLDELKAVDPDNEEIKDIK